MLGASGCSSHDETWVRRTGEQPPGPTCDSWLRSEVDADEIRYGCYLPNDSLMPSDEMMCTDGRVLYWTAALWGYSGEKARRYDNTQARIAPATDRHTCTSG
jgi:hypothetical protein